MKFEKKLLKGRLIKRYKRFFADIQLDSNDETITAHCPNTGSMKTCGDPGDVVYVLPNQDPKRKLKYTWELTRSNGSLIGVNTGRPNKIVEEGIKNKKVKSLAAYDMIKREVKYGQNSRIDLLLSSGDSSSPLPPCYVEVKNTTLYRDGYIVFPDAVTERGLKHIHELVGEIKKGHRAVMFYLVNRQDCVHGFAPADHIHPEYGAALRQAVKEGLEVICHQTHATEEEISLGSDLPIHL